MDLTPGAEEKLKRAGLPSSVGLHSEQIRASGAPEEYIKIMVEMFVGWRSLHTQGRGLMSALRDYLGDDLDYRGSGRGETGANLLLGWNFGDGHLQPPLPGDSARVLRIRARRVRRGLGRVPAAPQTDPGWFVFDGALGVVGAARGTSTIVLRRSPGCPTVRSR